MEALDTAALIRELDDLGGDRGRSRKAGIINKIINLEKKPSTVNPVLKQIEMVDKRIAHYAQVYNDTGAALNQLVADIELQEEIEKNNTLIKVEHENYKSRFADTRLAQ